MAEGVNEPELPVRGNRAECLGIGDADPTDRRLLAKPAATASNRAMPGEFEFIQWIRTQQKPSGLVPLPAGDDMAIVRWPANELLLVGIDQVLDGTHFDSSVHSPSEIGAKVMNRNLSDCAAMACLPAAAVASVALPRGKGLDFARDLYLGMKEAADRFDCPIIGGDTGSWDGKLAVTVTILGRSAGIEPIRRSGARPGDCVYVTGHLGGSILGRHMRFIPRIAEARALAATGLVTAMIDISDGLSRDLGHICRESGVGAVIDAAAVPIHGDARTLSRRTGRPALEHALHDGEDHELLLTAREAPLGAILIGRVVAEIGLWIEDAGRRQSLTACAWEHQL